MYIENCIMGYYSIVVWDNRKYNSYIVIFIRALYFNANICQLICYTVCKYCNRVCYLNKKRERKKMVNLKWDYLIGIFSMRVGMIAEFHLPLFY